MTAVERNSYDVVEKLLNYDSSSELIKKENKWGNNALHIAAAGGHLEITQLLIEKCPELLEKENLEKNFSSGLQSFDIDKTKEN